MQKSIKLKSISFRLVMVGVVLITIALILLSSKGRAEQNTTEANTKSSSVPVSSTQITTDPTIISGASIDIPSKKVITMSFASQAPFTDWSEPWQNACEEASIDTVRYYLDEKNLSKENMRDDILHMVDWEMKNWGKHEDLDAEKTLLLAKSVYGLSGEVIADYSADSIKRFIANGTPVIVPTDGRLLGNPNFRGDGPPYHMIVIKGYDDKGFITNDPGTRNGENYYYTYQTVLNAVKNPTGGTKELLILSK